MKDTRSASQILFGFLPEQTVDIKGGVWKVKDWRFPIKNSGIDSATLRREIIRQAQPWALKGMDGGFVKSLSAGRDISVYTLDVNNGVDLEPFPKLWICSNCKRVHNQPDSKCECGNRRGDAQIFFVGYHQVCGAIRAPYIPKCKQHKQVKVTFPGTSTASEIVFSCPVCDVVIKKGFGIVQCSCGEGNLTFQPHRASSVYTPRSVVIVNPPSKERISTITQAGGPPKALSWVVEGMLSRTVEDMAPSKDSLRMQLEAQSLPEHIIEEMLKVVSDSPDYSSEIEIDLPHDLRVSAESEAVIIALATIESRVQLEDLKNEYDIQSELGNTYRVVYPSKIKEAGLFSVDLIEKFPVLTGHFGYTRGDHEPGKGRLVPFKSKKSQGFQVYSEIAETEALFFRLDPLRVVDWLRVRGHSLPKCSTEVEARKVILSQCALPSAVDDVQDTVGSDILTLVHSFSHRFIRLIALTAGIDMNSLSELLVPSNLGFFIYAASRGDFVLGGLQALFETELHILLDSMIYDEHRCALDPGCSDSGGACMACLHVGEPSCRYFNRFLDRGILFGSEGYFRDF
ncbi:hypothetical protein P5E37_14350 [Vibrio parahaemolyticus]|uniref:hypothetical protein n=1 Tax=Vibrio parahaemolyticus TaxID=670 RepID=UPI00235E41FE|nr:hypothetical protein [Vibrio parahaemolyticus]MDG3412081.1 hypothetical protein [Vibrio parahaemolyticus]